MYCFVVRLTTIVMFISGVFYTSFGNAWLVAGEVENTISVDDQSLIMTSNFQDYHQIRQKEQAIRRDLTKLLEPHWSEPIFSDSKRWVSYSKDHSILRVIDFERNEFNLLLPNYEKNGRVDFNLVKEAAAEQLTELLSMTIGEAILQDPFLDIWDDGSSGGVLVDSYAGSLVFSEMFSTDKPNKRALQRVAAQLLEKGYIAYDGKNRKKNATQQLSTKPILELPIPVEKKINLKIPLPSDRLMKKAEEYLPAVAQYSKQYDIPLQVIFAIMHTESHFNPLARSHIPAFGLMQIVPNTAGKDVSKFLFKNKKQVTSTFLLDPVSNIHVGTGYLNVLYYRYLKKIENAESRLYCMIASYNTGTVNVARAFTKKRSMRQAASVINQLSSAEVLNRLMEKLPAKETRNYVKKVLGRAPHYAHLDQAVLPN